MFVIHRVALCCALSCSLLGCVPQAIKDLTKMLDSELEECRRLYPNPDQRPVSPRMKCIGDATVKSSRVEAKYGYKNLDLDELVRAQMVLLAERYDAGKITETEYQVEKAKIRTAYETQILQRQNSQAMVAAAQEQAAAASSQAIAASRPVSCTIIGHTASCF